MTIAVPRTEPVSPTSCFAAPEGQSRERRAGGEPPESSTEPPDGGRSGIRLSIVPVHTAVKGRARFQVAGLRGAPELAQLIERGLTGFGGVREVSASALTGNVLVCYCAPMAPRDIVSRIAALLRGDAVPAGDETELKSQHWHAAEGEGVAAGLGTSILQGLSFEEAGRRLTRGGANVMPSPQQRSDLGILLGQFSGLPVALLAGAAVVSVVLGSLVEAGAIMAVVALNGGIGFVTERRAERTIRSLEAIGARSTRVLRDGGEREILAEALVPGDIMLLQRGMVVPADGRLVIAHSLAVSEAALTGESLPVTKSVAPLTHADVPLGDRVNMVYRGSMVTGGSGAAIVVATGSGTEVGRIQRLVDATVAPATPLQRQLDALGEQMVWITLAASGLIFGAGWLRGLALMQLVRSSLSVAVAAVPEGLPMMATATLALGVEEMRRQGIFVRRLAALETLAAVNVICFDKTGTLTHGSMSLEQVAVGDMVCHRRDRAFVHRQAPLQLNHDLRLRRLLTAVSLCSETEIDEGGALVGTATENALVQVALDEGLDVTGLRQRFLRLSTRHRTETDRFMATTHKAGDGLLLAVKGSPPEVLARATWELCPDGSREVLTAQRRREICGLNTEMATQGLRVLGVACRDVHGRGAQGDSVDVERLVWIGLVGLADPVRSGLPEVMEKLHACGIQTIMLTGDQSETARAVGRQIRLSDNEPEVIATDIDQLSAAELGAAARRAHAFARISPGQKLRIVRALQDTGAVVAMIGDGINDSPALRAANVGIAVSGDATAAAREVADIFFATDDLAALPMAIERGRATYTNIRRAIHYILSTNGSEIALMLAGSAAGMGEMLTPMQLLWVNLVSDVLPAISISLEPPDADVMRQPPRPAGESILSRAHLGRLGTEAGIIAAGAFASNLCGAIRHGPSSPQASTMAFGSLVTAQLLHALTYLPASGNANAGQSAVPATVGGSLIAQSAAMLLPGLRHLLGVAPLGFVDVVVMAAGGLLPFFINATRKAGPHQRTPALHFRRAGPDESSRPVEAGKEAVFTLLQRRAAAAASSGMASDNGTAGATALARRIEGPAR